MTLPWHTAFCRGPQLVTGEKNAEVKNGILEPEKGGSRQKWGHESRMLLVTERSSERLPRRDGTRHGN